MNLPRRHEDTKKHQQQQCRCWLAKRSTLRLYNNERLVPRFLRAFVAILSELQQDSGFICGSMLHAGSSSASICVNLWLKFGMVAALQRCWFWLCKRKTPMPVGMGV